ncbi:MAG: hypothetical protein CM1200mP30_07450 [Pseudomonadota bacterium]|nr:MAG: hypothetical protein CM1200mP30_07450 [Pseudomonadota bacterium]
MKSFKIACIIGRVYPSRHLEEPFDGILYAAVVSVGFATMEIFTIWTSLVSVVTTEL